MLNSKCVRFFATLGLALGFQCLASDDQILNKKISVQARTARPVDYIALILREGGTPGGIEDFASGCEEDSELQMPPLEGTLGDGLRLTRRRAGVLRWQPLNNFLLVVKGAPGPSILDTKVNDFTFNVSDPPSKTTNILLTTPAATSRMTQLGMSVGSPELGFAQAKKQSDEKVDLKDVTVLEILNVIAKSPRPRVWLYRQRTCGGHTIVTVNWPVK